MLNVIKDFFISYETDEKNINITNNLIFKPETKILLDKNSDLNPYFEKFKTHQFTLDNQDNFFSMYNRVLDIFITIV